MQEALNFLAQYQGSVVSFILGIVSILGVLKVSHDKYLEWFFNSGDLAEEYAELVDKVEENVK